jgi:hypothetical protein
MVTVCAWCERYLGAKEGEIPVSHGICAPCTSRQKWSDTPVLVVSRERAELRGVLEHLLQGEPAIRVVVERRATQRRREGDPGPDAKTDRRSVPDRRKRRADAFLA